MMVRVGRNSDGPFVLVESRQPRPAARLHRFSTGGREAETA